jgi:serine/threonine-protein kinase
VTRVLDFGVAKAHGRLHRTRTGVTKGKIGYVAPEQVLDGRRVDRRADLFSVGVTLWEMIVGRRVFHGDHDAQILRQLLTEDVPSLDGIVPPVVSEVVRRATAREPDDRYTDARAMAQALHREHVADTDRVAAWVRSVAASLLNKRSALIEHVRARPASEPPPSSSAIFVEHSTSAVITASRSLARPGHGRAVAVLGAAAMIAAAVVYLAHAASEPASEPAPASQPAAPPQRAPRKAPEPAVSRAEPPAIPQSAAPRATSAPPRFTPRPPVTRPAPVRPSSRPAPDKLLGRE